MLYAVFTKRSSLWKDCDFVHEMYAVTQPLHHGKAAITAQFFKQSLIGLNSEFPFSYTGDHTKGNDPNLPYYLHISGERKVRFIQI